MNYQKLIIVGNATRDAQPRQSKDGEKTFTTFDVGVGDGKDKTTYFPVVVFGKQGEAVAKYVTKGRHVSWSRAACWSTTKATSMSLPTGCILARRRRLSKKISRQRQSNPNHSRQESTTGSWPAARPPRRRFFGYRDNRWRP